MNGANRAAKDRPTLALQVLLCPGVDMLSERPSRREFAEGYFIEEASMGWFIEQVYPADLDLKDPRVSPIYAADLTGLPPAHIHTAEFDPLRDDGRCLCGAA